MSKMIVGVAGPAGSGKDTVGAWFAKEYGFTTYAMAGALKAAMAVMGFPEPADRELKEKPVPGFPFTWREAAQKLGTEWGRELDPDIWVKIAERQISRWHDSIVITDVRFENEAAMIRKLGGSILHLKGRKVDLGISARHQSENPVMFYPNHDYLIDNSDSLDDLYLQLEEFMNV